MGRKRRRHIDDILGRPRMGPNGPMMPMPGLPGQPQQFSEQYIAGPASRCLHKNEDGTICQCQLFREEVAVVALLARSKHVIGEDRKKTQKLLRNKKAYRLMCTECGTLLEMSNIEAQYEAWEAQKDLAEMTPPETEAPDQPSEPTPPSMLSVDGSGRTPTQKVAEAELAKEHKQPEQKQKKQSKPAPPTPVSGGDKQDG